VITYTRRKPIHKRLPLWPLSIGRQFTAVDVNIGMWRYREVVTLRFDIYSQTWRARCRYSGAEMGEFKRDSAANEISAALDAAIEERR